MTQKKLQSNMNLDYFNDKKTNTKLQFLCKTCQKTCLKAAKMSHIYHFLFTQKALFFLASVYCSSFDKRSEFLFGNHLTNFLQEREKYIN